MLIIYNKSTGVVVSNQGFNNLHPLGVPNIENILNHVVTQYGGTHASYDVIRLHDINDKTIAEKTITHEYTIQNGEIVFGDLNLIPEPEPEPPTEIEKLRIETAQANAEMFEMLLMMTGGSI